MNENIKHEVLMTLRKVMNDDSIQLNDDFFSIGGDSQKAMQLLVELKKKGLYIGLSDFFKCRNVEDIASYCHTSKIDNKVLIDKIISSVEEKSIVYDAKYDEEVKNQDLYIVRKNYKSVLLTGGTGYLGSHIAGKITENTDWDLYVLVRGEDEDSCRHRLLDVWKGYGIVKEKLPSNISVVVGDISQARFGMKPVDYNKLSQKIEAIIHSAAVVSHVEKWEKYEAININGTENIIKFATYIKKKDVNYISTIATEITEDRLANMQAFEEKSLSDVKSDVLYVQSKIVCERMLEEQIKRGICVKIFRMGFLVQNHATGKFQTNATENGFFNILKILNEIGVFPNINTPLIDLTYIDEAADAVVKLAGVDNEQYIYHIINNKITLSDIAKGLKKYNARIEILELNEFKDYLINSMGKVGNLIEKIALIMMLDQDINLNIFAVSRNEKTMKLLETLDFKWSPADDKTMKDIYEIIMSM